MQPEKFLKNLEKKNPEEETIDYSTNKQKKNAERERDNLKFCFAE